MLSDTALLWTRIAAAVALFLVLEVVICIHRTRKKASGGKSWAVTPGEVVKSAVGAEATHDSDDAADCTFEVRYRYRVGGKDYEGHRVRFGGQAHTTRLQAEEVTGKYPVGARVPVHYNPHKPSDAVLEPKDTTEIAGLIVFLVVFASAAAVLVAHSIAGKVLTTPAGVPLFAFLPPAGAIAFGIVAVRAYLELRHRRQASMHWPTVPGKITESGVETQIETVRDSKGNERQEERYVVAIRFAYKVGDREFHSSHWNWGWTALHSDQSQAAFVAGKYPAGKEVRVYYDPADPEAAVLDPSNKTGLTAPLIAGVFCILVGLVFLWTFSQVTMQ